MKANEFVKKFGIEKAKEFLDLPSYTVDQLLMLQSGLRCDELQQLVESHELVEFYGGLENAKFVSENMDFGIGGYARLKQAIADVESCGGECG